MSAPHYDLAKTQSCAEAEKTTWNMVRKRLASPYGIDPWRLHARNPGAETLCEAAPQGH
jgi:hypothetical protein